MMKQKWCACSTRARSQGVPMISHGDEIVCERGSHVVNYEGAAAPALWGAQTLVVDGPRGIFDAETLRAVLRRSTDTHADAPFVVGDLRVNVRTREAWLAEEPLDLSRKEFDLLALLASRPGEVVSKRALQAEIWHQPYGGADKTLDVHLSWLRRKLGETAQQPRYLHSVRGVGVKLLAPS